MNFPRIACPVVPLLSDVDNIPDGLDLYEDALWERKNQFDVAPAHPGAVALKLTDEFRENARACLELSRKAGTPESQCHWLAMAQYWFDLAVQAEDRKAIESVHPAALEARTRRVSRKSN